VIWLSTFETPGADAASCSANRFSYQECTRPAGDAALVAKLPADCRVEAGEEREFAVPLRHIRLFDAASGHALGTAGGSEVAEAA
jgi:hypothetical protein